MRKKGFFVVLAWWLVWMGSGAAQTPEGPGMNRAFLESVGNKALNLKTGAMDELAGIQKAIEKNEETIRQSERIIALAGRRNDPDTRRIEAVARDALQKAQAAKRRNEASRKTWELKKSRAVQAIAAVDAMLARTGGGRPPGLDCEKDLRGRSEDPAWRDFMRHHSCRCIAPDRPPLCVDRGEPFPVVEEKSRMYYWNIALLTGHGVFIADGSEIGTYATQEEAYRACREKAERSVAAFEGTVLAFDCAPSF